MKKLLLTTFLALGAMSIANAKVYKITEFTKAQKKEIEEYFAEGSGDQMFFPTNKGLLGVHIDSPAINVLIKAKKGECFNVTGSDPFFKAKKVSCSTNTVKKKMTQKQIDACVNKSVDAFRKEMGEEAMIRQDMLDEWESWCKAGK